MLSFQFRILELLRVTWRFVIYIVKFSKVGKVNIRGKPMSMRIWIRNAAFFLANLQFAICGLGQ